MLSAFARCSRYALAFHDDILCYRALFQNSCAIYSCAPESRRHARSSSPFWYSSKRESESHHTSQRFRQILAQGEPGTYPQAIKPTRIHVAFADNHAPLCFFLAIFL